MVEQLLLPGLAQAKRAVEPVYFALYPDPPAAREACRRASELKRRHSLEGELIPPERLHVSLQGIGDAPPERLLQAAWRAADRVRFPAFALHLTEAAGYGGRRGQHAVVLTNREGLDAVAELREHLRRALAAEGVRARGPRAFSPHLTLFYARRRIAAESVAPVSWRVGQFVLVRSYFGQGRHEVVRRCLLEG